jgi:hypothetical protein
MEVEKLKKESEEYKASRGSKMSSMQNEMFLKENKVNTEFLSSNADRVQAIKHVSTNFKPEYMSLEEVQRLKEEHHRNLLEIENMYYDKKKKNDYSINKYEKIKDQFDISEFGDLDDQAVYNNDELIKTLETKMQNKSLNKQVQKTRNSRGKQRRTKEDDRPLDNDEQRYLRNYMNFQLKKKYMSSNTNNYTENNKDDLWNTTRIRSLNKKGVVNRKDGMPGHIDREDYSLYYLSISSEGPLSLSFRSASGSKSLSKRTLNLSYDQGKMFKPKTKYSAIKSKKSFKAYDRIDPNIKKKQYANEFPCSFYQNDL